MMKSVRKVRVVAVVGLAVALALTFGVSWELAACEICSGPPLGCYATSGAGCVNCSAAGSSCANWEPLCDGGGGGGNGIHYQQDGYWW